jgi:hypothetical protein
MTTCTDAHSAANLLDIDHQKFAFLAREKRG